MIFERFALYEMNVNDNVQDKQHTNKIGNKRRQRKSLLTNYSSEYVIGDGQGDKANPSHLNTKEARKRKIEIKEKRHNAEETWNEKFYSDLNIQLLFDKLEYIDVEDANDLYQESRDYLKQREELKDNGYKNKFGEIQHANHIIAHLTDGRIMVLDEDWFCQYNNENKLTNYIISKQTYNFVLDRQNQKNNLNRKDKKKSRNMFKSPRVCAKYEKERDTKRKKMNLDSLSTLTFMNMCN